MVAAVVHERGDASLVCIVQTLDVHVTILNAKNGDYLVKETSVGRKNGSVYDLWVEMGAIEPEGKDEFKMLREKSCPMITKYMIQAKESEIELDAILDMQEVRLVTISPVN